MKIKVIKKIAYSLWLCGLLSACVPPQVEKISQFSFGTGQVAPTPTIPKELLTENSENLPTEEVSPTPLFSPSPSATANPGSLSTTSFNQNSPLGTNLESVEYYSADWVTVDLFLRAQKWITGGCGSTPWNQGKTFETDAKGWVKKNPSTGDCPPHTLMMRSTKDTPRGEYVLLWEGDGEIQVNFDGQGPMDISKHGATSRGIVKVNHPTGQGIHLTLKSINENNYIRNIRLLMPGGVCGTSLTKLNPLKYCKTSRNDPSDPLPESCGPGERCFDFEEVYWNRFSDSVTSMHAPKIVFHPYFLDRLKAYKAIRYMDWAKTNDSPLQSWDQRPQIDDAFLSTDKGVPFEYMIALSNLLGAAPWFTIPHLADSGFMQELSLLVFDLLRADLKVYLEYTNEAWNGMFKQTQWLRQEGSKRGLTLFQMYSEKVSQLFKIWAKTFTSRPGQLIKVVGSQAANAGVSKNILGHGDVLALADALAIAPYFGGNLGNLRRNPEVKDMSADELIQKIKMTNGALDEAKKWMQMQKKIASDHGLKLLAYEGGQHLAGVLGAENDQKLTTLFHETNASAQMYELYLTYLKSWKESGGELFMHFNHCYNWSKWGSWGALRFQSQPLEEAPKFRALMDFINGQNCWWSNCHY